MKNENDSYEETIAHIQRVGHYISICVAELVKRASAHDASKLGPEEKPHFDKLPGTLKGLTYGSPEYKHALDSIRPALTHHYENNSHHPEYHEGGVDGMDLLDVLEMLCDWKAATERHADGDIHNSLDINQERFGMSGQLVEILRNTIFNLKLS